MAINDDIQRLIDPLTYQFKIFFQIRTPTVYV